MIIGYRNATGLAPPIIPFATEEIHWLSPELDGDPDLEIVYAEELTADGAGREEVVEDEAEDRATPRPGPLRTVWTLLSRIVRHRA